MESQPTATSLEEVVNTLVDAGALAILYEEQLADHGTLQLTVYSGGELRTNLEADDEVTTESSSANTRLNQLFEAVNAVTLNDETYEAWIDLADYGIDPLGRQALYIHESAVSHAEDAFGETSIEDGLNAVEASLGSA